MKYLDDDWDSFYDCVLDATNKSLNKKLLQEVFDILPHNTQRIAMEWGLSDTVFRDQAYYDLKFRVDHSYIKETETEKTMTKKKIIETTL